jgi:hypothetical protein
VPMLWVVYGNDHCQIREFFNDIPCAMQIEASITIISRIPSKMSAHIFNGNLCGTTLMIDQSSSMAFFEI